MGLNATVQFRTSSAVKDGAFAVFEEMGISPSAAMQLFLQHVQKTNTLPFIITANPALEEKEAGYDDWLRDRLQATIKQLDNDEMPSFTTNEVQKHLKQRRADWRAQQQSTASDK